MTTPVLMYHRVCADRDAPDSPFVVTATVFARQLRWLASRGYRAVHAAELLGARASLPGGDVAMRAERRVAICFDDGYLDNYEIAYPLLRAHGLTATFFLVADLARRFNFWDSDPASRGAPLVERAHVREMAAGGMAFGSHGLSHRRVTELDDTTALSELTRSRDVLEQLLGERVDTFAYPYGVADGRTKALVGRAGYRAAFAVNSGPLRPEDDPLEIRRVLVGSSASDLYLYSKLGGLEKTLRSRASSASSAIFA